MAYTSAELMPLEKQADGNFRAVIVYSGVGVDSQKRERILNQNATMGFVVSIAENEIKELNKLSDVHAEIIPGILKLGIGGSLTQDELDRAEFNKELTRWGVYKIMIADGFMSGDEDTVNTTKKLIINYISNHPEFIS